MELTQLFETQRLLDEKIYDRFPELRGKNNLDWKILALQVELGECANEWRGFKKWSDDQKPRGQGTYLEYGCKCEGMGNRWVEKNPLLEEYVDCLHFILSIGLELDFLKVDIYDFLLAQREVTITDVFLSTFEATAAIDVGRSHEEYSYLFSRFIELGNMLGFTWEQIERAYYAKNQINHERQATGY